MTLDTGFCGSMSSSTQAQAPFLCARAARASVRRRPGEAHKQLPPEEWRPSKLLASTVHRRQAISSFA